MFITVIRKPSMMYEVSIALYAPDYMYEKEICRGKAGDRHKAARSIGLDFSMPDLLIDSEGRSAGYPHYYKQQLKRLSKEQRKLAHCEHGSKNYQKQRISVARLMQKCANQRLDFQHKLSRGLADQYELVCIEDLAIKQLIAGMKLGKSAYDNGWYQFSMLLAYKLKESNGHLQKVGRWFPSSRTCSQCGRTKNHLDLAERIYRCSCGNTLSRDINAAINIRREGERLYSKKSEVKPREVKLQEGEKLEIVRRERELREGERCERVRCERVRCEGERLCHTKETGSTAAIMKEAGNTLCASVERGSVSTSYKSNIIQ
jgi:putative transposase